MLHSPYILHCAGPFPPKFAHYYEVSGPISSTWFLGSIRPTTLNAILIESAIFTQYMLVTTDRRTNDNRTRLVRINGLHYNVQVRRNLYQMLVIIFVMEMNRLNL